MSGLERKLEALTYFLERITTAAEEGIPIIVEGKADADALRKLGVKGQVICVKASLKPLRDLLEVIKSKDEAIILTDFDRRGAELANRLNKSLEDMQVKPNLLYWKELSSLVKHDLKDVEGLASYINTLRKKAGKNGGGYHAPFL